MLLSALRLVGDRRGLGPLLLRLFQTGVAPFAEFLLELFDPARRVEHAGVVVEHGCVELPVGEGHGDHDVVVVLGAGPIGQMALQAVKTYGALDAYVTDVIGYRLDYAEKYGAKATINASEEEVVDRIMRLTDNQGVDVAIEASGAIPAVLQSLDITKPGGRIVLVGYPPKEVPVPMTMVKANELNLSGIHRYATEITSQKRTCSMVDSLPRVLRLTP